MKSSWRRPLQLLSLAIMVLLMAAECPAATLDPGARGRFYFFLDPEFANFRYKTVDPAKIVQDIYEMGATDVIVIDSQKGTVVWDSKVSGAVKDPNLRETRSHCFFEKVIEEAAKRGLNIWVALHVTGGIYPMPSVLRKNLDLYARDASGKTYQPPHLDALNPRVKSLWFSLIDEIAEKYNKSGAIKGFFWDEVWFNESDLMGGKFSEFSRFCKEEFVEEPGNAEQQKYAADEYGRHFAPQDRWWRRYVLFRQNVNRNFIGELSAHARSKGFAIINRPLHSGYFNGGWKAIPVSHGMTGITKPQEHLWVPRDVSPLDVYDNSIIGGYLDGSSDTWGWTCAGALQGGGTSFFTYEFIPFQEGNILQNYRFKLTDNLVGGLRGRISRFSTIARQWEGAARIAPFAILTYQQGSTLRHSESGNVLKANELRLMEEIQKFTNVVIHHVEDFDYWSRYRVLIAPVNSVQFLPREVAAALQSYLEKGHYLINFSPEWSVANKDFTGEVRTGAKILGLKEAKASIHPDRLSFHKKSPVFPGKAFNVKGTRAWSVTVTNPEVKVLAHFNCGAPAVTFTPVGKGGIVSFHFDLIAALDNKELKDLFLGLLAYYSHPSVQSDGNLQIKSILKKGNKALVSLYQKYDRLPASGRITIDVAGLGLTGTSLFRVSTLIGNQDTQHREASGLFSWEDLLEGIPITIDKVNQYEVLTIDGTP